MSGLRAAPTCSARSRARCCSAGSPTGWGASGSIGLLDPELLAPDLGWRLAFFIGAALGVVIFIMRLWIPESPRWLMTHGRATEADAILTAIEAEFRRAGHPLPHERLATI